MFLGLTRRTRGTCGKSICLRAETISLEVSEQVERLIQTGVLRSDSDEVPFQDLALLLFHQEIGSRHALIQFFHLSGSDLFVIPQDGDLRSGFHAVLGAQIDYDEVEIPVDHQNLAFRALRCGGVLTTGCPDTACRFDDDPLRLGGLGGEHLLHSLFQRFLGLAQSRQFVAEGLVALFGLGQLFRESQLLFSFLFQLRLQIG